MAQELIDGPRKRRHKLDIPVHLFDSHVHWSEMQIHKRVLRETKERNHVVWLAEGQNIMLLPDCSLNIYPNQ
jgi:hypothetical protein